MMKRKLLSLLLAAIVGVSTICTSVDTTYAKKNNDKNENNIEIITGAQQNAKDRNDDIEETANENDGSYEKVDIETEASKEAIHEETIEIHISTVDDIIKLSKDCSLDTWSANKVVILDNNISLIGSDFRPIPTFAGIFEGNNYTVSGLNISNSESYTGLFSKTQKTAVIRNLSVHASVEPSNDQMLVGGIVGDNYGLIENCAFEGYVSGYEYVGAIAGFNELYGTIYNCHSFGTVKGSYYTGGICGENVGIVEKCTNKADVNVTISDKSLSVENTDFSSYASGILNVFKSEDEKKEQRSIIDVGAVDTGGIAGVSIGVIRGCTNEATIGYEHVGYNVGGITGRQSGYIDNCVNKGKILGRKDVAGIAGQAEPYIKLDLTDDTIDKLRDNINMLHDDVTTTLNDAGNSSDTIHDRLSIIKDFTGKALDDTEFLSDRTIGFIDSAMDSSNELISRADYLVDEISKTDGVFDKSEDAFEEVEKTAKYLKKIVRDSDIYRYMTAEEIVRYNDASDKLEERIQFVSDKEREKTPAYTKAYDYYNIYHMKDEMDTSTLSPRYPESTDLIAFDKDGNEISASTLATYSWEDFKKVAELRHADGTKFPDENDGDRKTSDSKLAADAGKATAKKASEIAFLVDAEIKVEYYDKYGTSYVDDIADYSKIMADIVLRHKDEMEGSIKTDVAKSAEHLRKSADDLSDTGSELKRITKDIADKPDISMPKLGEDYRQRTNSLNGNLKAISEQMGTLNDEMSGASNTMVGDMQSVNDKFNDIMSLYSDALDDIRNGDLEDKFDDISLEEAEHCIDATICACKNFGRVEADIDAAGIAGAMGVEYDFDLESDATRVVREENIFSATYLTKCVLRSNVNDGEITAVKNYAGGVCGFQEMGLILRSENYAPVKSESGQYVGGICGSSESYVLKSFAKCRLDGEKYIGGITGFGCNISNCYSMITLGDSVVSYVGAIAGDASDKGKIHYNYFVGEDIAGIDRVSYTGKAEPVTYYEFTSAHINGDEAKVEIPKDFETISIRFYLKDEDADEDDAGEELKFRLTKQYGESLSIEEYPEVPEIAGKYVKWDITGVDELTKDQCITAEYVRYNTTLASEKIRENGQSVILVDGYFSDNDELLVEELSGNAIINNQAERFLLTIPEDKSTFHKVRYAKPDGIKEEVEIYDVSNGTPKLLETSNFGKYITFDISGNQAEFAVVVHATSMKNKIIACAIATAVLLIIIYIIRLNKHKKQADKSRKERRDAERGKDEQVEGLETVELEETEDN